MDEQYLVQYSIYCAALESKSNNFLVALSPSLRASTKD